MEVEAITVTAAMARNRHTEAAVLAIAVAAAGLAVVQGRAGQNQAPPCLIHLPK